MFKRVDHVEIKGSTNQSAIYTSSNINDTVVEISKEVFNLLILYIRINPNS